MKPVVAIVGRPNVGKSTLFNRITRSRKALVDNSPGVTRDRNYGDAQWDDVSFTLVDTGGFSDFESEGFGPLVKYQVMRAIEEADAIITLFDGREGVTPIDTDLVQRLRQCRKPVFYSVNKIHGPRHEITSRAACPRRRGTVFTLPICRWNMGTAVTDYGRT